MPNWTLNIRMYNPNIQCYCTRMIDRIHYLQRLSIATDRSPVTALLGPRQCGKTTLARLFARRHSTHYFDLESPADQQRLQNPELILGQLQGMVILDEVQIKPELFNVLRVLVDRPEGHLKFLILGSASPHIMKHVSETLAGRVEFIELSGFNLGETTEIQRLWLRGGVPRSFLAHSEADSQVWRDGFYTDVS